MQSSLSLHDWEFAVLMTVDNARIFVIDSSTFTSRTSFPKLLNYSIHFDRITKEIKLNLVIFIWSNETTIFRMWFSWKQDIPLDFETWIFFWSPVCVLVRQAFSRNTCDGKLEFQDIVLEDFIGLKSCVTESTWLKGEVLTKRDQNEGKGKRGGQGKRIKRLKHNPWWSRRDTDKERGIQKQEERCQLAVCFQRCLKTQIIDFEIQERETNPPEEWLLWKYCFTPGSWFEWLWEMLWTCNDFLFSPCREEGSSSIMSVVGFNQRSCSNNWGLSDNWDWCGVIRGESRCNGLVLGNCRDGVGQSRLNPVSSGESMLRDLSSPWSGYNSCRGNQWSSIVMVRTKDCSNQGEQNNDGLHL